jgi:hypothetical protein
MAAPPAESARGERERCQFGFWSRTMRRGLLRLVKLNVAEGRTPLFGVRFRANSRRLRVQIE